ncbi:MAG: lipid A biosynthesis protein [Candidatus Omnitrophica bacterium]|nr:lipid A biosynthesis protein [Candidatus Omnitrophota bacterium]
MVAFPQALEKIQGINKETLWLCVGFLGQALFFFRFFVQWLASEKKKECVVPLAFWYLSISGGFVLLLYALRRQDPVFIVGQSAGIFVYLRNLYFIHSRKGKG